MKIFQSVNPYTGNVIAEYEQLSDAALQQKIDLSASAFRHWRTTSFEQRAAVIIRMGELLRERKETLAHLMTAEMGKVLAESRAEIEKSAANCDYYAANAQAMLQDEIVPIAGLKSSIVYDPIGCLFAVMPWNFPLWQILRYAAPALMAGNVTILKHAPNVFGCAAAIEQLFLEAGLPEGCFQSVVIDVPQVEQLIAADIVQGITLTGSEQAGSSVGALAGKHIKKAVLELGGSDAFLVLADADIEKAAKVATTSRMINAGQACNGAKRFMIQSAVYEQFIHEFQKNIAALNQGNPVADNIQLGPLARPDLAQNLDKQLQMALQQGAHLALGGQQNDCNFAPTLLTDVTENMVVFQEETFGPLACVSVFDDLNDAIDIANRHRYGLAAAVWTQDEDRAYHVARQLEVGNVFVNSIVRSDSRLPFGGIKKSGFGRELSGIGIREFMNVKTLVME